MPHQSRRNFHQAALAGLGALVCAPSLAQGEPFPNRPIRIVAPFAPGGGTDFIARAVAAKLSERLGQAVVVENRPGAGGLLGTEYALKQAPDGYTLLLVAGSYTVNPSLYKLKFDPLKDMTPIIQLSHGAYVVVVHPSVAAKTMAELVGLMKKQPGQFTYGSSGPGGHIHVVSEYLLDQVRVKALHVPYKGTGPAITDLMAGNVSMLLAGPEGVMQHVRSGRLRALAVTTAKRLAAYPDLPTVAETVAPGYDVVGWHGLIAPAGVPPEVQVKLNREIAATLKSKDMEDRLEPTGVSPAGGTPDGFGALIKLEIERYASVIKQAGIKLE
jgi:tripartite-type tricarboxylate transporter receptor subunit TctC